MKKILSISLLALALSCLLLVKTGAQNNIESFSAVTNIVTTLYVPDAQWKGNNAMNIGSQLLSITNLDGTPMFKSSLVPGETIVNVRFEVATNGTVFEIDAHVTPPTQ